MVVADQNRIADVVFVVEGTANLSPYVESLKQNYILPTLEHFNGGPPDDRDCGCDYNSTLYTLVVFMASDHVPEPATTCFMPTPSTYKFMSALDKVQFIGGCGDGHSNIAEGLSTCLQVFDDFQTLRDNGVVTQKHCILVCNSPPYSNLPSWENSAYSGLVVDQLAALMNERQIHFSILSPRKIPDLLKLYEKAGGDLQLAMSKSYAKDCRHLVLLKGYQLQERPISPPPLEPRSVASTGSPAPSQNRSPTPVGLVPLSQPPSVSSVSVGNTQTTGGLVYTQPNMQGQPMPGPRAGINTHLGSLNQPNPPNVTITNKGPSMEGIRPRAGGPVRINWNQQTGSPPVSTPPPSLLATQLSLAPVSVRQPMPGGPHPQGFPPTQQNFMNTSGGGIRPGMSPMQVRGPNPQQQNQQGPNPIQIGQMAPFPGPPQPNQQQGPLGKVGPQANPVVSNPQLVGQLNPGMPGPGGPGQMPPGMNMPPGVPNPQQQQQQQQQQQHQQQQQAMMGAPVGPAMFKDRSPIWHGNIEFQEKGPPGASPANRVSHTINCTIFANVINGEVEVTSGSWPSTLCIQLVPKQLVVMANLFTTLKNNARHVVFHFGTENERCQKLIKTMTSGFIGVIQFPQQSDIRIMLVLYTPDKRLFSGIIANDQEGFYNGMRQMYENHRIQQQAKQKKLLGMQQQQQQQQQQQPQQPQVFNQNSIPGPYQLQQISSGQVSAGGGMPIPPPNNPNAQGLLMTQANPMGGNPNQMGPRPPLGPGGQGPVPPGGPGGPQPQPPQQQQQQQNQQQQPGGPNQPNQPQNSVGGMVHPSISQQQASRLSILEQERQQNLLKIQHLQQTLEAAQQKELQLKAGLELQHHQHQHPQQNLPQHQQQTLLEQRQRLQLQQQQRQLQQLQQQVQQQSQQITPSGTNPQLRNLLQQQNQQLQMRQQPPQMMMQQQGQISRGQVPSNVGQPGLGQIPQQGGQQQWDESGIHSVLDLM